MKPTINIIWFRRDLRLSDNAALYHALQSNHPVVPIFIFDKNILDKLNMIGSDKGGLYLFDRDIATLTADSEANVDPA